LKFELCTTFAESAKLNRFDWSKLQIILSKCHGIIDVVSQTFLIMENQRILNQTVKSRWWNPKARDSEFWKKSQS
jgi:hypothetical protein